jgi:superfamily II DNA or RNA helicase
MLTLLNYQNRAVDAIKQHNKGLIVIPTGGGKTVVFMQDAKNRIANATEPLTFVIVAPRIMLAVQLAEEFENYLQGENVSFFHVHSGGVKHHPVSTNPLNIELGSVLAKQSGKHHFIFTTYNSLPTVNKSGVSIDVAYFDEAHHCVKPSNFVGIAQTSANADNAYFFTATPRVNNSVQSMNNTDVYGQKIISIPAQELIDVGSIIPPKVETHEYDDIRTKENAAYVDAENVIEILSKLEDPCPKVLIAAPSSKVIWSMFAETDLTSCLDSMGYKIMHITSKHGAYIGKKKVSREVFFNKLNEYGNDPNQKFVLVHYSILSEGMNVHGLTHCILLRNLPSIEMCQTIGRVVRMHKEDRKAIADGKIKPGQFSFYKKPCGKIIVPVNQGASKRTIQQLQSVVDAVFVKGEFVAT